MLHALFRSHRIVGAAACATALAGVLVATTPPAASDDTTALAPVDTGLRATSQPEPEAPAAPAATTAAAAPDRARPPVAMPVKELGARLRPDVLVVAAAPFTPETTAKLADLSPAGGTVAFRAGTVKVAGQDVRAVAVDPSTFRTFAAEGTAEATAVWQSVARGEAVLTHDAGKRLALALGGDVPVTAVPGGTDATLRLGAFATTGVPAAELVVDDETGRRLGLPALNGMLLTAGKVKDPVALAEKVRVAAGQGATVDLLTPPAQSPVAFLSGSKAAKAFGAFSYRYFADGTIQPDAAWVRANIRTETMPVLGRMTCHRLMLPQLRGALEDIKAAGLDTTLETFDGCYVPRFIARDPERSISLHTWGIAVDFDAATNYQGIPGDMHPEVVNIFKRWGFRWGGDWKYTDPMHFELAALITEPRR